MPFELKKEDSDSSRLISKLLQGRNVMNGYLSGCILQILGNHNQLIGDVSFLYSH